MNEPNEDFLIPDSDYEQTINETVLPELEAHVTRHTLKGKDGANLFCSVFSADEPIASLVLIHGFTDNSFKFSELIWSLMKNRISVVAYDQRGHGLSWRLPGLSDVGDTHVDHFDDYIDDLQVVCDRLLAPLPRPWFVFGHSMGGAVTAFALERFPGLFDRAVLCAPMIAPNLGGLPYLPAAIVCRIAQLIGHGSRRVFFFKPYSGPEDFSTSCAMDPVRFGWYDKVKQTHPEYQNCSPTYSWTLEAMRVTKRLLSPGAPESISCPVMLYSAESDNSVLSGPQKQFISRVPQGKRIVVPGSRHEIYRSPDSVLFPWWHEILQFLKQDPAACPNPKASR